MNHIDTIYSYPVVKMDGAKTAPVSDEFAPEWREFVKECPTADIERWTAFFDKKNARPMYYVTESASLIHRLSLTSHNARYRIVILWLPERMNEETANKLLKLIEEPADDTLFIMVSDSPRDILPTIYSRTQRVEVKRLPDSVVARVLTDDYGLDATEANAVAHIAEGNINVALKTISTQSATRRYFDTFVQLMRLAYMRKVLDLKAWADKLADTGREEEIRFYSYATHLVRENFIYNFGCKEISYLNHDEGAFSVNFARFINEANVEQLQQLFDNAIRDISANGNGKLINFDVALKVCFLIKQGQK